MLVTFGNSMIIGNGEYFLGADAFGTQQMTSNAINMAHDLAMDSTSSDDIVGSLDEPMPRSTESPKPIDFSSLPYQSPSMSGTASGMTGSALRKRTATSQQAIPGLQPRRLKTRSSHHQFSTSPPSVAARPAHLAVTGSLNPQDGHNMGQAKRQNGMQPGFTSSNGISSAQKSPMAGPGIHMRPFSGPL